MTTIDDLDLPSPHAHLTVEQMNTAWNAEWAKIRAWRYELTYVWALYPTESEDEVRERKIELMCLILRAIETTHELEDTLTAARKPRPTDIPKPWGAV